MGYKEDFRRCICKAKVFPVRFTMFLSKAGLTGSLFSLYSHTLPLLSGFFRIVPCNRINPHTHTHMHVKKKGEDISRTTRNFCSSQRTTVLISSSVRHGQISIVTIPPVETRNERDFLLPDVA